MAKKAVYAPEPSTIPRSTTAQASLPCWACAKAAKTRPKTGKGAISPLSCGPSWFATAVMTSTKPVATSMRAGRSQRGGLSAMALGMPLGMMRRMLPMASSKSASAAQMVQCPRLRSAVDNRNARLAHRVLSGQLRRGALRL